MGTASKALSSARGVGNAVVLWCEQNSTTVGRLFTAAVVPLAFLQMCTSIIVGLLLGPILFFIWSCLFVYGHLPTPLPSGESVRARSPSLSDALRDQPQAFLSDDCISATYIYRFMRLANYYFAQFFHGMEFRGLENLPSSSNGALLISMHSTHNADILPVCTGFQAETGRAPRGLVHRVVATVHPWCKYIGLVPGERYTGKNLLRAGFLAAVLPGGGEEAMCGHENAYNLHPRWDDRRGFAHIAKDAGVDIIPVFMQNSEEMRFNPVFYLANVSGFSKAYMRRVDAKIPYVSWLMKQAAACLWFSLAYTGIPVPVKTTTWVGKPVRVSEDDDVNSIALRSKEALAALIAKHQPYGHAYLPGLQQRFAHLRQD